MIRQLLVGMTAVCSLWSEQVFTLENTNYTLSQPLAENGKRVLLNYDRFRMTGNAQEEEWFVTAIADVEHYLGRDYVYSESYDDLSQADADVPFKTQTRKHRYGEGEYYAELYRLYGGYTDERQRISLGLQKVSMGVGRIWNPTDLFNPINPLALEPDEVFGVFALSYTYSMSDLSEATVVAAQCQDHSFKYAGRIKGYVQFADMGVDVIKADDAAMIAYEIEGGLMQSGIALRSEGGWFEEKVLNREFFQGLVGADYAFENSLILAGEWLYSSKTFTQDEREQSGLKENLTGSNSYIGITATYEFDPLFMGSVAGIASIDDQSFYIAPSFAYSLSDDASLGVGAMLYAGDTGTEFGDRGKTYYLKLQVTF